jgi:hypothetical protein
LNYWSEHLGCDTPAVVFSFQFRHGDDNLRILCECGEFINGRTFKDYIETSSNPSTSTIGHRTCGLIFNFIDGNLPKRYSSKKELKAIAIRLAESEKLEYKDTEELLIEVDRLKSRGNLTDGEILNKAFKKIKY